MLETTKGSLVQVTAVFGFMLASIIINDEQLVSSLVQLIEDVCPLICWRHSGVSIRHLQLTPVYSLLVGEPERGVVLI